MSFMSGLLYISEGEWVTYSDDHLTPDVLKLKAIERLAALSKVAIYRVVINLE